MKELQAADSELRKILPSQKIQPDTEYKPSQYVLQFSHGGRRFLFHTMTRELLEAELPERCLPGQGFDHLIETYFLVPLGKDECAFYQEVSAMMRSSRKKNGHGLYTILPTTACNARCAYCYEKGIQPITMSSETIQQTVRYILNTHSKDKVRLKWVGGEPLLCPDIIDQICAGLREAGLDYRSTMVSNGSLITPLIADKMQKDWNLNRIHISMDGAEKDCIARKQYIASYEAYHTVMEGISLLAERGIRVIVRCNVDEENWDGTKEFLNDMKAAIPDKTNVWISFTPLFQVRRGKNDLAIWEKVFSAKSAIEAAGFHTRNSLLSDSHFRVFHCMADGGNVTINSDGSLYACGCFAESSRFGDIFNGITNESARREFCSVEKVHEKCRHCPFLPECTAFGSCPYQDTHCRKVREMDDMAMLKQLMEADDQK
jgi:radical SAM protein with 4Fe4S-binding SPASM domain